APDRDRLQRHGCRCDRRRRGAPGAVREDGGDRRGHAADARGVSLRAALLRQGRHDRLRQGMTLAVLSPPCLKPLYIQGDPACVLPAHRDSRDGEPPSFHSLPPETGDVSPRTACAACCPAPFSPNPQCSPKQRSRQIMPTISRRQFPAAFGGIPVAALAASATTLPAAAEPGGGELDPLRSMRVPRGLRTADGPIWSATATGFAGLPTPELPHGTVGGYGGSVHVVR